ncbi:FAD-dependent oxidoreductase [Anaerospora hongkongensis]|uniref:FAD-dependent oxidoreductase n=1 Tax=Anaerospora hongkongensis TaxID=244830 RepID=UPI0028A1D66F|nr:FAD-dependent oxidoreductase [Anaerospora hongkongensis]
MYKKEKMELPVLGKYDVVIAGGGTAGFAAGVSAARAGARTLIIEKDAFLGGTATGGMISQFMGFVDEQETKDVKGIMGELLNRLSQLNASDGVCQILLGGRPDMVVGAAGYDSEVLKYVMDEMIIEAGAEVIFHSKVVDVCVEDNFISGLIIHNNEGLQLVKGKVVIDATFHGEVAAQAGCIWEKGRPGDNLLQPSTLMFRMANVDYKKFQQLPKEEKQRLALQGVKEGNLFIDNILCRPLGEKIFFSNMSRLSANPLNIKHWSGAEMEGRRQVQKIVKYFNENVSGFEEAILVTTGSHLGLRDSRRIMGRYLLTKEDIMNGTKFDDAVAVSSYPIDIHDAEGHGYTFIKPQGSIYYIPYRCMINDLVNNLIVTGRCISSDYEAHGSVRVMVVCIQLGEAAGLAAALSASTDQNANQIDVTIFSHLLLS